jgi:MFS family permease
MLNALTTLRESFSPLQLPNFRLYLSGQFISLSGTWLQNAAQSWLVWTLTGSESNLGIVGMLNSLPILLFGAWTGVWAERLNRRKLLIGTQLSAMTLAFVLGFLVQTNAVQIWHVYVLSFLLGCVTAFDSPAQQAFLGDLSGLNQVRKAVNMNAMIFQVSRMIGPSLAAFLIGRFGQAPAFWINGLSYLVVVGCLLGVQSQQKMVDNRHVRPLREMRDAFSYWSKQPRLQDIFIFAGFVVFFVLPIVFYQLSAVADSMLGGDEGTFGFLAALSGAGALVAVLIVVPLAQTHPRRGIMLLLSSVWTGIWLLVFGLSSSVWLSAVAIFMGSVGLPTIMTMALAQSQVMVPADMRARMVTLFTMVTFGLQPFAIFLVGQSAEHFGLPQTIQGCAILVLLGSALMYFFRDGLRDWQVREGATSPAPAVVVEAG